MKKIYLKLLHSFPFLHSPRLFAINFRDFIYSFFLHKLDVLNFHELKRIKGKTGLEIGGPSWLWRVEVPIYRWAHKIDNFNRLHKTFFGQSHIEGRDEFKYFLFKKGDQYISDKDFSCLKKNLYDFVLMRDVLEHVSNPIKMLIQLRDLIKPFGIIVIAVPNKLGTFDYARPYTSFGHMLDDYLNDVMEDDQTHYQEAKDLMHDHMNPQYSQRKGLSDLIDENLSTRILHHHVFSEETIARVCSESGFRVLGVSKNIFPQIIIYAEKYNEANLAAKPDIKIVKSYEHTAD
jgi:hypothetical protein